MVEDFSSFADQALVEDVAISSAAVKITFLKKGNRVQSARIYQGGGTLILALSSTNRDDQCDLREVDFLGKGYGTVRLVYIANRTMSGPTFIRGFAANDDVINAQSVIADNVQQTMILRKGAVPLTR
jgi:hypothetical protein